MKSRFRMKAVPEPESPNRSRLRVRSKAVEPQARPRYIIDWSMSWGAKLQLYLMSSFLYYNVNRSVITDNEYDRLCVELKAGWRTNRHPHKSLITVADLDATTGYAIKYPLIVRNAALYMLQQHSEVR